VLVPAGTPPDIINTLNSVIVKTVQKPEFRARMAQMGADTLAESPDYFRKMLAEEIVRWAKVIKISKATAE
jgi:tripartite-type tricarboxylate transporter receptor subunit TctC